MMDIHPIPHKLAAAPQQAAKKQSQVLSMGAQELIPRVPASIVARELIPGQRHGGTGTPSKAQTNLAASRAKSSSGRSKTSALLMSMTCRWRPTCAATGMVVPRSSHCLQSLRASSKSKPPGTFRAAMFLFARAPKLAEMRAAIGSISCVGSLAPNL